MTLRIYMKSGNCIVLPHVKEYKITNRGDEIIGVELKRRGIWSGENLLVKTIALSQIEAITKS